MTEKDSNTGPATAGVSRIAVVGAGVAGITAAALLGDRHRVTLFEKNARLGGHTNTVVIESGPDTGTAVDTGFIVPDRRLATWKHLAEGFVRRRRTSPSESNVWDRVPSSGLRNRACDRRANRHPTAFSFYSKS